MPENRIIIFVLVLAACAVLQAWRPRRQLTGGPERFLTNLGLMFTGSILVWLIVPAGAVAAAWWAEQQNVGLLRLAPLPDAATLLISIAALDLAIYWQHRAMHRWPLLWRLHRVHHSDIAIDTTTGVRFHPLEILLSMTYKMVVVILLGASPAAVLSYEVILSSFALFNHSNWAMPFDSELRHLVVTPDVHRVHHSSKPQETNSNYGNFLVFWDRLFGSFIAQPAAGHEKAQIGLEQYRTEQDQKLLRLLANPLK